ncbi:MAG: universal stress protein [Saprospirales bacterium]|nr:universal stress protein [Saprospirales bacterium]
MKTPSQNTTEMAVISPFEVIQALVALELADADEPVLNFFDFFSGQVPVGAAYFIHVLPKIDFYNEILERNGKHGDHPYEIDRDVLQRMELKIKDRLPRENSIYVEFDIKEGDPLEEILKDAEDIGADLIIIGQRSETEAHGILAKNLVRKAKGNALVVPDRTQAAIKNILIPIDFSANSIRALQTAIALNKRLYEPANLTCLNIYDMPNLSVYKIGKTREQLKNMLEEDRNNAFKAFLHTYASEVEHEIKTVLVERDLPGIARYVLDFADENAIDFIIMGAKGHSKVDLLLMGSVTEKLLTMNDKIPTLVVK